MEQCSNDGDDGDGEDHRRYSSMNQKMVSENDDDDGDGGDDCDDDDDDENDDDGDGDGDDVHGVDAYYFLYHRSPILWIGCLQLVSFWIFCSYHYCQSLFYCYAFLSLS